MTAPVSSATAPAATPATEPTTAAAPAATATPASAAAAPATVTPGASNVSAAIEYTGGMTGTSQDNSVYTQGVGVRLDYRYYMANESKFYLGAGIGAQLALGGEDVTYFIPMEITEEDTDWFPTADDTTQYNLKQFGTSNLGHVPVTVRASAGYDMGNFKLFADLGVTFTNFLGGKDPARAVIAYEHGTPDGLSTFDDGFLDSVMLTVGAGGEYTVPETQFFIRANGQHSFGKAATHVAAWSQPESSADVTDTRFMVGVGMMFGKDGPATAGKAPTNTGVSKDQASAILTAQNKAFLEHKIGDKTVAELLAANYHIENVNFNGPFKDATFADGEAHAKLTENWDGTGMELGWYYSVSYDNADREGSVGPGEDAASGGKYSSYSDLLKVLTKEIDAEKAKTEPKKEGE